MPTVEQSPKIDGIDKYEVENAAETLRRTQELRLKPKLLTAARKVLRQQQKATQQALNWAAKL